MTPRRVLLIGGKTDDPMMLAKAHKLGIEVVWFQKKSLFDASLLPYVAQAHLVDYERPELLVPLALAVHGATPVAAVLSLTEPGLIPASIVTRELGLPGNSVETVRLLKDKWSMRRHLDAVGLSPVRARVGATADDVAGFVTECGKIIVKPIDGAGSFAIFSASSADDAARVVDALRALGVERFLMEEYLDGHEISVEAFSLGGRHTILAVTDKLTGDNFVEIGHSIPAQLDPSALEAVQQLVTRFLDAVGLQDGPSHTELKLTSRGPRVIESHNRAGGDRINELVRVAYGIDMVELAFAAPFGEALEPLAHMTRRRCTAIRFIVAPPGVVERISGIDEARVDPDLVEVDLTVAVGARVRPLAYSPDRCGHVLGAGATVEDAVAACERALRKITIATA